MRRRASAADLCVLNLAELCSAGTPSGGSSSDLVLRQLAPDVLRLLEPPSVNKQLESAKDRPVSPERLDANHEDRPVPPERLEANHDSVLLHGGARDDALVRVAFPSEPERLLSEQQQQQQLELEDCREKMM